MTPFWERRSILGVLKRWLLGYIFSPKGREDSVHPKSSTKKKTILGRCPAYTFCERIKGAANAKLHIDLLIFIYIYFLDHESLRNGVAGNPSLL